MRRSFQRYLATFLAIGVLALSFVVMALGSAGVLSSGGAWRTLMIPGYLTMLVSAVLATSLSIRNSPVLWLVSIALTILPFVALDWLRSRFHRPGTLTEQGHR